MAYSVRAPIVRTRLRLLAASLLVAAVMPGVAGAAADDAVTVRLSGPLPAFGDVSDPLISPDGTRVAYLADDRHDDVFELFVAAMDGGDVMRVHPPLPASHAGFQRQWYHFAEDGRSIVYVVDDTNDGRRELYVRRFDEASSTELTPPLGEHRSVVPWLLQVSPDGRWVVSGVRTGPELDPEFYQLFAVSLPDGTAVALQESLPSTYHLHDLSIAPDSANVAFVVHDQSAGPWGEVPEVVYTVPIAGGPAAEVFQAADVGGIQLWIDGFTGDSRHFLFTAGGEYDSAPGFGDQFSADLMNGTIAHLNESLPAHSSLVAIAPAGGRVLLVSGPEPYAEAGEDLWSVSVTGGPPVQLDPVGVEQLGGGYSLRITGDGSTVAYRGSTESSRAVYTSPIVGGPSRQLSDPNTEHPAVSLKLTADDQWVVYQTEGPTDLSDPIYAVPLAGGAKRTLTLDPTNVGSSQYAIADGAQSVVFESHLGYDDEGSLIDAWSAVPIGGGPAVRLPIDRSDSEFQWPDGWQLDPAGSTLVFIADLDTEGVYELYASPIPRYECGGVAAAIVGTDGDDVLEGTWGPDVIVAGAGDDTVRALGGRDRVCGDSGDDRLLGGAGRDLLWGGAGNDEIRAGPGDDTVWAGPGADAVVGMGGRDLVAGGGGDDVIDGGNHDDRLYGGPGDDVIYGSRGSDLVFGEAGRDVLRGGQHDDRLLGGSHPDELRGGPGVDECDGAAGRDVGYSCEVIVAIP